VIRTPFFGRLIVFLLPMLLLFISLFLLALYSGEALPPRVVYETQSNNPGATYMTSHREGDFLYKYYGFLHVQPDVLFLGASRVVTFRAGFLNRNPDAAYNASLPGHGLSSLEAFIDLLTPENAPKIMLLQVDQFWFNADWPISNVAAPVNTDDFQPEQIIKETRHLLRELLTSSVSLDQLLRRSHPAFGTLALGVNAIRNGEAYAVDGGIQHVPKSQAWIWSEQQLKLQIALEKVRTGEGHYLHGDEVNEAAFEQLARMLDKAVALDIQVIGFAPGFMPTVYTEMIESGQYSYLEKAMPHVAQLFEEQGFHFFDFTDVRGFIEDTDMQDGNHTYEIGSLKLYMRMVEGAPELLGQYSELESLQQMLEQAASVMEVVPREYASDDER
jgi:hypothetical protein